MKKSFSLLLFLILGSIVCAQKKYPSLLWEIQKGNSKPSYLYGTMHVSERIAFHLSDVFFEKLLATDKIALESNPEIWLDEMQNSPGEMGMMEDMMASYNFYNGFTWEPLQTEFLRQSFLFSGYLLNGIMYRTYDAMDDYQEDTYLDMFIYQTGKRTNREIVSLENFKESRELVEKAALSNRSFEPPVWAKKMMMEKPLQVLMENAYRDKDLDMIDSISRGTNSPKYNEYMLFQRNRNMVHRMDSIFQKGETLFIGIGAAHLPGKEGVIEILRSKGYTVKPVLGEYTQKGKNEKERLDHAFKYHAYTPNTTPDKTLTINSASKFYDFDFRGIGIAISPDLQNGSFINVIRMKKHDFLRKSEYKSGLERIDSLLFENIPGKITQKEKIKINGFDAFDISNKTKDGDSQRYWIISTPIEYILICMLGKDEFVEKHSPSIASSISLNPLSTNWKEISTTRGGFSVQMPEFHTISSNDPVTNWFGNPQIIGYDSSDDSYYFLIEKSLSDINYLEETEFELKRMHYEFYKKLKIDSLNGKKSTNPLAYTSQGKLNNKKNIRLKSVINGSHYYLLGSTGNENKTQQFFNSFQLKNSNYLKEPKVYNDSTMNFTVKTPIIPEPSEIDYSAYYNFDSKNKNHFQGKNFSRNFLSDSRQTIIVNYREFDRYDYYEKVDSLWNEILKNNEKDYKLELMDKKISQAPNGDFVMETRFKNNESEQIIKAKYLTNGKYFYSLKTLLNKDYKNDDPFVEEFYNSFSPKPNKTNISLFDPKIELFLADTKSPEDSIRKSALKSIYQIKFKDEDFPKLVDFLENYEFKKEENIYKKSLISKIGNLKHPQAEPFLKNYYLKNIDDSDAQIGVLESFATKNNTADYQAIVHLLKEDIPLPSNPSKLNLLFGKMSKNKDQVAKILPDLMDYRTIPEYQDQLIAFSANLLDSGKIQATSLKPFHKDFLTLGKLELKRAYSSWKASQDKKSNSSYYNPMEAVVEAAQDYEYEVSVPNFNYSTGQNNFGKLKNYLTLLQPFSDDKETEEFLAKVDGLQIPELLIYSLEQKLKNKDEIPSGLLGKLASEEDFYWKVYKSLKENKQLNLLPKQITKEAIAKTLVIADLYNFDKEKDSIQFLTMRNAQYKDKKYEVYFFKVKKKNSYTEVANETIETVAFELDKDNTIKTDKGIFNGESNEYIDEEYLETTMKNEIDRVLFRDKKRVSFIPDYYFGGMYGF